MSDSYIINSPCRDCIHNYANNGEGVNGCRAFPSGIPIIAQYVNGHVRPINGQKGDFVFKKASYDELTPYAQYFWLKRHGKK